MFDDAADAGLTAELEALVVAAPSSGVLARLEELRSAPLTRAQRMLVAACWDRLVSYVSAGSMVAQVDSTESRPGDGHPVEVWESDLALMLRRSDAAMARQLWNARAFVALPRTFAMFAAGEVQFGHLHALADLTVTVSVEHAEVVDARVADRAATLTVGEFRRLVRSTVAAVDPDALARRHVAAKARVGVRIRPAEDGMASLTALLPALDAIDVMDALNARADTSRTPDDVRTHGQRQIDALLDAVHAPPRPADNPSTEVETGSPPRRPGRRVLRRRRAEIGVLISWQDLVGLRDGSATLDGHGPVPAQCVRGLLADDTTVLRRIVYDEPTGDLLDYTATSYAPDTRLRELLATRDRTCRYPGCTRPAWTCDCEHRTPHADGGATSTTNCGLVCRHHHNHKTHHGFTYTRPDPATGETRWTTALGFTYTRTPTTYSREGPDPGDSIREPTRTPWPRPSDYGNDPPF